MTTAHPVVILHNVSFEEIMGILSFIYRGQCIITEDQLPSFLAVAKLLKIQGLCDMKVSYIYITVTVVDFSVNINTKLSFVLLVVSIDFLGSSAFVLSVYQVHMLTIDETYW